MLRLVIVVAFVVITTSAVDSGLSDQHVDSVPKTRLSQQCAGYCKASSKFSLGVGSTYVYDYVASSVSLVSGTSNRTSEVKITAKAFIHVTANPCELILQIKDSTLYDSGEEGLEISPKQYEFSSQLEQNALRFSFQDGRVDQLCPSSEELPWALNVKRGVLSALQNSMRDLNNDARLYERDISGNCDTVYTVKPSMWNDARIFRQKELHSCSNRVHQILGLPRSTTDGTKSTPIIKSEQFCDQTINTVDGPFISRVKCVERHTFAPFSNKQSGISTIAELSLNLEKILQDSTPTATELFVNKRTTLQIDFSETQDDTVVNEDDVWHTLNQLTLLTQQGVDKDVPNMFSQLIAQLERLDSQQLVKLFDEQKEPRARKFFVDALPLVGSPSSVRAMFEIFNAQEVTREELHSWLTALAFHKQPTLELLQNLNLFMQDSLDPKSWLAVSSVVHSYCQRDSACADTEEVRTILSHIEGVLGESCNIRSGSVPEKHQAIVVALKAIGNAGLISSVDTLKRCFLTEINPVEVRLAAISALRRFPCSTVQRLPMLELFHSQSQDTELRIAAYLTALQCPTTAVVSRIRDSLYEEDTNQVLSFVWTHLTNLQESSASWRREVRQMLQDSFLVNKFKTDARKFSRNYEMSFYSDMLNAGASIDSNVIFNSKSYLPRSATLNLTLDLFGESLNVFELGTRMEGFESMVEEIFSKKGIFPDESMEKMLKNMRSDNNEKNEVIQSFSEQFTKGTINEPQGTIFARVFGNELYLTQFNSLKNLLNLQTDQKNLFDSLSSLFNSKEIDNTKSFRILNTKYSIPTILGLPLHLEVNSTATVGFQLETEVDMSNILKTRSGTIDLKISPSVAVRVDGKMFLDAVFTQAGVETKGTLSSNTYLDTRISVDKGQMIDVSLNVPRDKVEVVNVVSEIYLKRREKLEEIEGIGEITESDTCSGKHVPTISGMRLCSQISVRNASAIEDAPYFPLTGRFQYELALHKSDSFNAYNLHLKQLFDTSNEKYSGKFLLEVDTPGSQIDRRLYADLKFDSKDGNAHLEMVSPQGSFLFSGKLGLSTAEKTLDLKAQVNGEDYANINVALATESTAKTIKYEPRLLVVARPNFNINVTGRLNIVPSNKYSADFTAAGLTYKPIALSGDVTTTKGRYQGTLSAKAEAVDLKMNMKVLTNPSMVSCKTLVRYVLKQRDLQTVEFAAKVQNHKKGGFRKKHLALSLQMSELPEYSTKTTWILYRNQKYFDSNIDLTVGKTQWKSQQMYHNNLMEKIKNFEIILSLESPTKNLDYRTEVQYKVNQDTVHAHTLAQLSKAQQFISRLDYQLTYPLHSLELELATPWKRAFLGSTVEFAPGNGPWNTQINSSVICKWGDIQTPHWMSAKGVYRVGQTFLSTQHMMRAELEVEEWKQPLQVEWEWKAESADGLIHSDIDAFVLIDKDTYSLNMKYVKDPILEKHDVNLVLAIPQNTYSGSLHLTNNQELKNLTVRLDLEKTLYFTTQLRPWKEFDLQLFWDYQTDLSESVMVQYRNNVKSEVAVVSMPGHYAALTVDKLGLGLSSMNVTAMWGESEGSANNAILLSTYWLLDMTPWYAEALWLPTIQTRVHLVTPFLGFEQQSFLLHVNGSSENDPPLGPVTREIQVSTKWQDQHVDFELLQIESTSTRFEASNMLTGHTKFAAKITSSLETLKDARFTMSIADTVETTQPVNVIEKSCVLDASYNTWGEFSFNSTINKEITTVYTSLNDKTINQVIFSADVSLLPNSVSLKSILPLDNKVEFVSDYQWPTSFKANLTTSYKDYEDSSVEYFWRTDAGSVKTKVSGNFGGQHLQTSADLKKTVLGFQGMLELLTSSSLPDLSLMVEHELRKMNDESYVKEFASVVLKKKGKTLQSSQALLLFVDELPTVSSSKKSLQTVLELPGHYSSSNYSYETQVKITGREVHHQFQHTWNKEKTEASLSYEGYFSSVSAFLKRNNDKKAEFYFKRAGNENYRTDIALSGGYSIKHRLFFKESLNWENFLMVSSNKRKVNIKNLQTFSRNTAFSHKTTISIDKEVSNIDLAYNIDSVSSQMENILFSVSTPWSYPVVVKYDLLLDTGVAKKHEITLRSQNKETQIQLDTINSNSQFALEFFARSPYASKLEGKMKFQFDERQVNGESYLTIEENSISIDFELMKSFQSPVFAFNLNSTDANVLHVAGTYNLESQTKHLRLLSSYKGHEVSLKAHFSNGDNTLKTGFMLNTPLSGWIDVFADLEATLSKEHSKFVISSKKDDKFAIISADGILESDFIKSSLSVDYHLGAEPQKHYSAFELTKGKDNFFTLFEYSNDEKHILYFTVKLFKDLSADSGNELYKLSYQINSPFKTLQSSELELSFANANKKQVLTGTLIVHNWKGIIEGENTMASDGIGYFDVKMIAPESKFELYFKHIVDDKDTYTCRLSNNAKFISTTFILENNDDGVISQYYITSSEETVRDINGIIRYSKTLKTASFESTANVNEDTFIVKYNTDYNLTENAEHTVFISMPKRISEDFKATLKYSFLFERLMYLQGEVSKGTTTSMLLFVSEQFDHPQNGLLVLDLPGFFKCSSRVTPSAFELTANSFQSEIMPEFVLNLTLNKTNLWLETDNSLTDKLKFAMDLSDSKLNISFETNKLNMNACLEPDVDSLSVDFKSNIPNWTEANCAAKYKLIDKVNDKYSLLISRERNELFYGSVEGFHNKQKGERMATILIENYFADFSLSYDFSSNFSVDLQYNINGDKKQAGGKMSFLPDSSRIDLSTPIKGFEDLTFIGTMNRNNKKVGLVFQKNGKTIDIELSAIMKSEMITLKGTLKNGKDEYTLTFGTQNGSSEEPGFKSFYLSALTNSQMMFWISLEGAYNPHKKTGVKFSFSCVSYKQIYLEIMSENQESNHLILFNYLYGIDVVYLLKTMLEKNILKPVLTIDLQVNALKNHLQLAYDIESEKKIGSIVYEGGDRAINFTSELSCATSSSILKLNFFNQGVLNLPNSVSVFGNYNFTDSSMINIQLLVNEYKYFSLNLMSQSLYNVAFESSLIPSDYLNMSYDVGLNYEFAKPNSYILSKINMSVDYYLLSTNLTWSEEVAEITLKLDTNRGYGFKTADLRAKYVREERLKKLYSILFTIDDSQIFDVTADFDLPKMAFINLSLPDSLFLPFAKKITAAYNRTYDQKQISIKYSSESDGLKECTFFINNDDEKFLIYFDRTITVEEGIKSIDRFVFVVQDTPLNWDLKCHLLLENENLFAVSYTKESSKKYSNAIFSSGIKSSGQSFISENTHSWKISLSDGNVLNFTGQISPKGTIFSLKHPSTVYHQWIPREIIIEKTLQTSNVLNIHYKSDEFTNIEFKHSDPYETILAAIQYHQQLSTSSDIRITFNENVYILHQEQSSYNADLVTKIEQTITYSNIHKGEIGSPSTFHYILDLEEGKFQSEILHKSNEYKIGGTLNKNPDIYICSSFHVYLNSSAKPQNPFVLKYETNCQSSLKLSLNPFSKSTYLLSAQVEFDHLDTYGIKIETQNLPVLKDLYLSGEVNKAMTYIALTLNTAYNVLKQLEITSRLDSSNSNYFGKFIINRHHTLTTLNFDVVPLSNGSFQCIISSNKDFHMEILLDSFNKEITGKVKKNGNSYEGKGGFNFIKEAHNISADAFVLIDEKMYKLEYSRLVSNGNELAQHRDLLKLTTPSDKYYMDLIINKESNMIPSLISIRYNTPFQHLDFAELNISCNTELKQKSGSVGLKEFDSAEQNEAEKYKTVNSEMSIKFSLRTKKLEVDDALFVFTYGNEYSIYLQYLTNSALLSFLNYENTNIRGVKGVLDIRGFENYNTLLSWKGTSMIEALRTKLQNNYFASAESPLFDRMVFVRKCSNCEFYSEIERGEKLLDVSYFSKFDYANETVFELNCKTDLLEFSTVNLKGNWKNQIIINLNCTINDHVELKLDILNITQKVVSVHFDTENKNVNHFWSKELQLHVQKLFWLPPVHSFVIFKSHELTYELTEYSLEFDNGITTKDLSLKGNFSILLSDLTKFSSKSTTSIKPKIVLTTSSKEYEYNGEVMLKPEKFDTILNWRKRSLLINTRQNLEFSTLKLGGSLEDTSAEIYINGNKFNVSIHSSSTNKLVSVNFFSEKSKKDYVLTATFQISPSYHLNVSHTFFENPCSIEIKINRLPLSIESAMTIVYNNLQQQAFINVYLDGMPKYAELMYNDIWQQTHEASIHVTEKEDEVTVRSKVESPAMDEHFLIITISNNNDKLDLNLNDAFILKAFKDESFGYLDLFISEKNYKVQYKNENETEIKLTSPKANGEILFSFKELDRHSFFLSDFNAEKYHLVIEVNREKLFNLALTNDNENIFKASLGVENNMDIFQLDIHCDSFDHMNSFSLKHTHNPTLLKISLKSPYYLQNNLDLVFAISNNSSGSLSGLFVLHQDESTLFEGHLLLDQLNRTLQVSVEAPMFSKMDKGEINAVFNVLESDCEIKLSAYFSSEGPLVSQASVYYIKNDIFATGLVVKSDLSNFEDLEISIHIPITLSKEMKLSIVSHLPFGNIHEVSSSFCLMKSSIVTTGNARWRDLIMSFEYKIEENSFYKLLHEININFMKTKVQIGAWMNPNKPITDYIYFFNIDGKQMIEISHAFLVEQNHFKCKLNVETQFKGHKKYSIDLELQNLKIGKIVRLLGSAPMLGEDLGIDFGYNYESLLNYGIIAQAKIPFGTILKQVRLNSMNKIHSNLKYSKLNHSLECSSIGIISWEFESYGSVPFIWQEDLSALETKLNLNNNIYSLKTKTFLQSNKVQLTFGLETPFEQIKKGEIHFTGTRDLIGSDLSLSLNSKEIVNVNITKDAERNNHIVVLSKWRNVALKHLYEGNKTTKLNGYVCWDLLKRNVSQFGLEFRAGWNNLRYETATEILMPSPLIPKVGFKSAFENEENEHFSLIQLDLPTLVLEGKLARKISNGAVQVGSQIKWSSETSISKNMGLLYIVEKTNDETKRYITLQHFALENDLMLSLYSKDTLYGLNLQYSPVKDEEITLEAGYWMVEDGDKERSGVKLVVLHPVSDTLVYTVANMTSTKEYTQTGMSIAYIGNEDRNKVKYIEIFGKKNMKTPEIFFGLASNGNSMGIGGSVWKKENYLQGVTLEARINQKDPLRVEVVQNLGNPGVEAELSYSPNRNYRIYAGMPNSNELTARLSHSTYGKPSLDALASLRLNTSRILWGRFELPSMAEVGQEFFSGIAEEYSEASLVSQAIAKGFCEFVQEDFSKKVILILNSINEKSNLMVQKTGLEFESVFYGFKEMERLVQMVYEEDHFFIKTAHQYLQKAVSAIYSYISRACEIFTNLATNMFRPIVDVALQIWNVVSTVLYQWVHFVRDLNTGSNSPIKQLTNVLENYQTLRVSLVLYGKQVVSKSQAQLQVLEQKSRDLLAQAELTVNQLIRNMEQVVNDQLRRLHNFKDTILAGFTELRDTVKGMLEIMLDGVYRIREVRYSVGVAVKWLDSANSWFINFRLESYLRQLDKFLEKVAKLVSSDFQKNFGEYEVYLGRAKSLLEGHYEEINKIPQVQYIKIAVNNVYQKLKWFWNYAKLSNRLRDGARRYLENMKAALDELESKLEREEGDLRSEYSYIAENNSFIFTQELPFEWKAFDHLPEYNMDLTSQTWTIPAQEYSNMVSTMANYLWQDAKLLPYLLPAFGTEAFMSGDSFITFDNSFYHFSGDCNSYLLAGDLYQDTFSLIVNYNSQNDKDILLITDNDEVLLKNNLEVFVNGKRQDLPSKAGSAKSVSIERKIHGISIKSDKGFSLECSSYQDVCIFRLDGWFMGKTAGLLGTYSNEPSDDLINPSRQSVDNVKQFTDSWALDTKSCENREDLLSIEDVKPDESMCELFFKSQSSPFFPCFHVVNPGSFFDMCASVQKKDYTCSSVMAYLTKCTSSGVQLWMPDFCAGTSLKASTLPADSSDSVFIQAKYSADVVLLLESTDCVNASVNLSELTAGLETDLQAKGMSDNQYSFVSFNDKGAQILTVQGQPWTNSTSYVADVVSRMEVLTDSTVVPSYHSALDLASNLPYRPGVSKVVILIHCSSCPFTDNYAGVLERFTESDISLHILQKELILGKKGKGVSKAIGLEKGGAYSRKRLSKNSVPSPQLLQQVSVPQDMCTPVMLSTNGTLFSMDVTKKSLRAWTGRVAKGAVPLTDLQQCVRTVGRDDVPIWRCRSSTQREKIQDWDKTALEEYLDTSHTEDIYPEYEEN